MNKVEEMEKLGEIQKKNSTFNFMLSFCVLLTFLSISTIIWQNTKVLEKISDKLTESVINSNMVLTKIIEVDKKVDLLFKEKYENKK